MKRHLVLGILPALLGLVALACQMGASSGPTRSDLIATQVAVALTQTAMAATITAVAPPPTATTFSPTGPPPPTLPPSPTPLMPTATLEAVTPPYEGPCTTALLQPSTGPTPNPDQINTFVGYRFTGGLEEHFPILNSVPRFGAILNSTELGPGSWGYGFAMSGYLRKDLNARHLFLERMVCRTADGRPHWEITDVLALPYEGSGVDTIYVASHDIWFPPGVAERIHTTAEFTGDGWATLTCPLSLDAQPIALLRIDPASIPPTITKDTTVSVTATRLWVIDPTIQKFRPIPMPPGGVSCSLVFHW